MKPIPGYEDLYSVTPDGRVWSYPRKGAGGHTGIFLVSKLTHKGYFRLHLIREKKQKNCYIHRLVAEAFIPNPLNLPQVNHKNGIKIDNRVVNLEWCTNLENMQHSTRLGLRKKKIYV